MNLTDLSAELESRAGHTPSGEAPARLAGVRTRVRVRRRRQATAAALVAAGCVVAAVLGPSLTATRTRHRTEPAAPHRVAAGTFDDMLAGDPLTASVIGSPGQSEVVLRFTPTDTNLSIAAFCHVAPGDASGLQADTTVNGHGLTNGTCQSSTVANESMVTPGDGSAQRIRAAWADLGVVPGRESVMRIGLRNSTGAPRTDPSVRLGVGLYALTGDRLVSDGLVIKRDAESDGHDYRLAGYLTAPVTGRVRQISLPVPAGRWPVYITSGTGGDVTERDLDTTTETLVDGSGQDSSTSGGLTAGVLHDSRAHTVSVRTTGSSGVLLLAYYERVD